MPKSQKYVVCYANDAGQLHTQQIDDGAVGAVEFVEKLKEAGVSEIAVVRGTAVDCRTRTVIEERVPRRSRASGEKRKPKQPATPTNGNKFDANSFEKPAE